MPAEAETVLAHQTPDEGAPVREQPSLPSVERRSVDLTRAEFREQSDKMIFEGRAAVFGEWAQIGDFRERIVRGAFRKADFTDTVFALNHNYDLVMARTGVPDGPGSLHLEESTRGLDVYAELAPTQTARDTKTLVETGVIRKMSFAWPRGATVDDWNDAYTERSIGEFKKVTDVSPVVFPAYAGTEASTRSLVDALAEAFRPDLPVEERIAAYQALLSSIDPDSRLASELLRRAIGIAAPETADPATADTAEGMREGLGQSLAAVNTRLLTLRLKELTQ